MVGGEEVVEVLRAWPRIRAGVGPGATLHVYYGFTPKFLKWGRQHMRNFDAWLADTKALLDQPGVVYVGLVDQVTLARAYARAGYCLYPTSYPETGCVSLMKPVEILRNTYFGSNALHWHSYGPDPHSR